MEKTRMSSTGSWTKQSVEVKEVGVKIIDIDRQV